MMRRRKMVQLELPRWGGRRKGAGRPRTKGIVQHRARPTHTERFPLHVTLKIRREVGTLRSDKRFQKIKTAFHYGCDRFGMRLVEFSVQDTHIHLLIEAKNKPALSRGMQGLAVRIARAINRASSRRGKVFLERYFAKPLKTVAEVRNAIHYIHKNAVKHQRQDRRYVDPYSSMEGRARWYGEQRSTVAVPETWLCTHARPRYD
jgi:REP element-mobilizing transposase RayT